MGAGGVRHAAAFCSLDSKAAVPSAYTEEPPVSGSFSRMATVRPPWAAASAADLPDAPEPMTTTSYSASMGSEVSLTMISPLVVVLVRGGGGAVQWAVWPPSIG